MDFKQELKHYQDMVNKELEKYLRTKNCLEGTLNQSMEYSLMAGGKRLRPTLVLSTYSLFKNDLETLMLRVDNALAKHHKEIDKTIKSQIR